MPLGGSPLYVSFSIQAAFPPNMNRNDGFPDTKLIPNQFYQECLNLISQEREVSSLPL
ncbi:hypothetical protein PLUA15_470120 [Pseudomonas lundensis]|uniref:Uncharacterized protein n=1 Tax=Pseudomonas lundensis TaxID=86185 RepID=A0AAX2HCL8_9PSED|nr:hypothetical protein PLUA15_470120 [Pseudomonas lundensis]